MSSIQYDKKELVLLIHRVHLTQILIIYFKNNKSIEFPYNVFLCSWERSEHCTLQF